MKLYQVYINNDGMSCFDHRGIEFTRFDTNHYTAAVNNTTLLSFLDSNAIWVGDKNRIVDDKGNDWGWVEDAPEESSNDLDFDPYFGFMMNSTRSGVEL